MTEIFAPITSSLHDVAIVRDDARYQIKLVPFADIKLGKSGQYLVKGLIPQVGLVVVWGPPKNGKSFLIFDLMMHVALGWEYRGRRVTKGPVIYCAFEGQAGVQARVEAFRQRFLADHNLEVPFYLMPAMLDLIKDRSELIIAIRQSLNGQMPVAVVLDTLNRSLVGSESSDEDMGNYVKAADLIREAFGCVVIVVHHCGHDASRPRGHTSLMGAVDAQIAVKRLSGSNIIEATTELVKDGPEGEKVFSELEIVELGYDEDGEVITSCVVVPVAAGQEPAPSKPAHKLTKTQQLALECLVDLSIDGQTPNPTWGLPQSIRSVVPLGNWRKELLSRSILNLSSSNPTARWTELKTGLQAKQLIAIREDFVWDCR